MKKTKWLLLLTALIIASAMVLTGCQKEAVTVEDTTKPTDKPADDTEDASAPSVQDLETVELKWYVICAVEQDDQDMVEEKINEYTLEKINATVDIIFLDAGPYQETVGTKLAAGEPIDICFTSGWAGAAEYRQNAAVGNFVPLNDYLKEGGLLAGTAEILGENFLSATRIDGINYAIPCNKEKAHNWGFLFRKDIVEELNLDIQSVKDLDTLETILAAVKAAYPEMIPLVTATGEAPYRLLDWNTFLSDDVVGALYPDNRDNTVVNQFAMPETKAHFEKMHEFYEAGYIRADADTYTDWQNDLDSGLGFCVSQSLKPGKDIEYSQGSPYDFIQVECTEPVMSNREADGSMMAIPVASENPDRAAMLLELANTDKYFNNLLNYGIEGYHFTKVSDNIIELSADNAGWRPNVTWVFPNQFMNYVMSSEDPDKFVNFTNYNESAVPMNNLGFVFNGSEVDNYVSAIRAVSQQYTPRLFSGASDPAALLPEFLEKLDAAGADELIAEMQAQYDEWLANK